MMPILSSFFLGFGLGGFGAYLGGPLGVFFGMCIAVAILLIKFEILNKMGAGYD